MPLAILRSPLPVKEWVGFDQEEADRHYSLGYREGLRDGLLHLKALSDGDPQGFAASHAWHIQRVLAHVEETGGLPGKADRAG